MRTPVVDTTTGKIRGRIVGGVYDFRGVRYGSPTGGAGRFLPARSPTPSDEIQDALHWGPRCPQILMRDGAPSDSPRFPPSDLVIEGDAPMSEDCLFLNVSTTGLADGGKRPVMVWLHGGGFSQGSSSLELMSGINLARNGDGVVVTANHRLGLLGHLFLGEIAGGDYASSGNVGLLDIVLALRWVRDNIAQFGGDPDNVTLFGQSGGNLKVACVLAMPASKGLVHKAILQSVGRWIFPTREQQSRRVMAILDGLNIRNDPVSALQVLPVETLITVPGAFATGDADLGPVIDEVTLLDQPHDMDGTGSWPAIPTMLGFTADEAMIFPNIGGDPEFEYLTRDGLRQRLLPLLGDRTDECLALYEDIYPDYALGPLWGRLTTDWMYYSNWAAPIAERIFRYSDAPLYMYIMGWNSPGHDGFYRAPHCVDIPFVFANTHEDPILAGPSADAQRLGEIMSKAWMEFARKGDPTHEQLPLWPRYSSDRRELLYFASHNQVQADPKKREREFWSTINLPAMSGEYP